MQCLGALALAAPSLLCTFPVAEMSLEQRQNALPFRQLSERASRHWSFTDYETSSRPAQIQSSATGFLRVPRNATTSADHNGGYTRRNFFDLSRRFQRWRMVMRITWYNMGLRVGLEYPNHCSTWLETEKNRWIDFHRYILRYTHCWINYISTYIILMDPSTFLGSAWGMILGINYLLRRCLDLREYDNIYIYVLCS